jgi:hypothetical protein
VSPDGGSDSLSCKGGVVNNGLIASSRASLTQSRRGEDSGTIVGRRVGDPPESEAEHFIQCPACNGWIDCRDLGQVFEHEGPLPHPLQNQPQ